MAMRLAEDDYSLPEDQPDMNPGPDANGRRPLSCDE